MSDQSEKSEGLEAYNVCQRCGKRFEHLGVEVCDACGGTTDLKILKPSEFANL